jgi:hypothetical protein
MRRPALVDGSKFFDKIAVLKAASAYMPREWLLTLAPAIHGGKINCEQIVCHQKMVVKAIPLGRRC